MTDPTHGFTKQPNMTEWQFARFLRRHGAIDTWAKHGNANFWHRADGTVAAIAFYTGPGGMAVTYWVRTELLGKRS